MRVLREMYPLCCIPLESNSPAAIDEGPMEPTLLRTESAVINGSDASARGSDSAVSVAGLLYKWTNYHKGWRSRWFTLRNGVLSYSTSRTRPENLSSASAAADDLILIGGDFNKRHSSGSGRRKHGNKSAGIVHLKV